MAIKINGVTVIDDNKTWQGNAISGAAPTVCACKYCGANNITPDLASANYYNIRANTPVTISCICNIDCCSQFYMNFISNDGSKVPTLPSCFNYGQFSANCTTRNTELTYKFDKVDDRWLGCVVDKCVYYGDVITPITTTDVAKYMCSIGVQPDCVCRARVVGSISSIYAGIGCGLCRDLNLLHFRAGGSIYTVYTTPSVKGFMITEPLNCVSSSVKTICTYSSTCSMSPRLLGYSVKCDFILVGTFDHSCLCYNAAFAVLEAYKLSDALKGDRSLLQCVCFSACTYPSTAASLRTLGGCLAGCATYISGLGGLIGNFNFDECNVPLVVSDAQSWSPCCNSGVPIDMTNSNDGMKIWLGPNLGCVFCYCLRTNGFPGYPPNTCQNCCVNTIARAFYTKDGKYAITVDTLLYPTATYCRFEKRVTVWRDSQHNVCSCASFTGLATVCDISLGTCTHQANFELIYDCCMCHVLYFGKKESTCICAVAGVGYSRTTDGCCYVESLPLLYCNVQGTTCNPYTTCFGVCVPSTTFGICLEKNCLYSTNLIQANGVLGCGASFNPSTCRWNITTTAIDTCCFCCLYDGYNPILLVTNPRDASNNYVNPLYVHNLSNTALFTI